MTNGTAVAEPAKKAELSDEQKKARIAELQAKLAGKIASGDTGSQEFMLICAEIGKLGKVKAPKAESDPAKVAEKEGLQKWLKDVAAEMASDINKAAGESFPILAKGGMTLEVVIRPKGVGRSSTAGTGQGRANMAPRIVHRKENGERFINEKEGALNSQGLPSLKKLLEHYPQDAEKINAALGTAELRKEAWTSSNKDKAKKYVTLSDGTYLTLQS